MAAALSIEAGELQEAILWKTDEEAASFNETAAGRLHIQRELADILIYALLLCHETGIEPDSLAYGIEPNLADPGIRVLPSGLRVVLSCGVPDAYKISPSPAFRLA